jgi:hypothetical protein
MDDLLNFLHACNLLTDELKAAIVAYYELQELRKIRALLEGTRFQIA